MIGSPTLQKGFLRYFNKPHRGLVLPAAPMAVEHLSRLPRSRGKNSNAALTVDVAQRLQAAHRRKLGSLMGSAALLPHPPRTPPPRTDDNSPEHLGFPASATCDGAIWLGPISSSPSHQRSNGAFFFFLPPPIPPHAAANSSADVILFFDGDGKIFRK